jgi:hypothetical protein
MATLAAPSSLSDFMLFTEIDDASHLVSTLFQRKFGHAPPNFSHHFVAIYCGANNHEQTGTVLAYTHMLPYKGSMLSGGSCTNGDALRRMSSAEQALVAQNGGVWRDLVRHAFAKYEPHCDAFFGHCGDARAMQVCLDVGFVRLPDEHLIARWHKPLSDARREELLANVRALGAF